MAGTGGRPPAGLTAVEEQALRGDVDALRDELAALRDELAALRAGPLVAKHLIRRDLFADGDRLRDEHRAAAYRLRHARPKLEDAAASVRRCWAELTVGGPFRDGYAAQPEKVRAALDVADAEHKECQAEVAAAEAALREAEEALRPYVVVHTHGLDLSTSS